MTDSDRAAFIARTSRELFLAKSYGSTSLDDVARECRISKRTLYRLFPTKASIFAAIMDANRQSIIALPREEDDRGLRHALEEIFQVDLPKAEEEAQAALLQLVLIEAPRYPELSQIVRERGTLAAKKMLAEWLEAQQIRGRIHVDDPVLAATILLNMIFGDIVIETATQPAWGGLERGKYVRRCIAVFLEGVVRHFPSTRDAAHAPS